MYIDKKMTWKLELFLEYMGSELKIRIYVSSDAKARFIL